MALKKKPAISVDGAVTAIEETVITSTEIPLGFYTFGYFAMKYLVVKSYRGQNNPTDRDYAALCFWT